MKILSLVAVALATAFVAGCATTNGDLSPSASPVFTTPNTDAPSINNADAAGPASVPGYSSVPPDVIILYPETP